MSSSVDKSSGSQSLLTGQNAVYGGIAWAVISLLFFLLFSISAPGEGRPLWYMLGTYILETTPFLVAAFLCYRNWRSPQIASGRNVWLGIGLGMTAYSIANIIFGVWELYWGLDPDVSPADLFYLVVYICLGWGMVLAVLPRRLNLETWQWITVGVIAVVGIAFAIWVLVTTAQTANRADATASPAATELTISDAASPQASDALQAPLLATNFSQAAPATKQATVKTSTASEKSEKSVPAWVMSIEEALSPLATPVNFFYIIGDVVLLIIASTLLLAFWGGRFAQSWRMLAAATFCLYIADMCFKYADATAVEYESGSLPDVFYVFSGVLFAIGAALEYDVSSRSRRGVRKRA
jgi:hypothetical protein